ncbi:MAG: hypothetical protein JNM81_00490 [Rhodospirillaceae bacterium]|nr:hypothetical protein [Rhodospirillaceae bacterium]
MTTIPPTAAPAPQIAAAAASGPVVVVQQPSPQILQLPPGATLETVVLAANQQQAPPPTDSATPDQTDARQTVTLRTPAGDVTVRTAVPLDDGAKVALEILRSAPNQVTARMVTIDGQPAQQVLTQTARDAAAQTTPIVVEKPVNIPNPTQAVPLQPGQAWTPTGPAPLANVNPLSAFVLTGPVTPNVQAATQTPLQQTLAQVFQPGTDLGVRIVSLQTATPGAPIPQALANAAPAANAPITPQVTQALNATIASPGPASTQQTKATPVQPAGLQPTQTLATPNAQPNAAAPKPTAVPMTPVPLQSTEPQGLKLASSQSLNLTTPTPPKAVEGTPVIVRMSGQVIAAPSNGAVVVQTPAGELQLNVRANVPVGSTITFEVITTQPPRADAAGAILPGTTTSNTPTTTPAGGIVLSAPTPSTPGMPLSTPAMGWGSFSESIQLLQRVDPQAATQLAAAIPDGGPRTALAAMAFVQAMRSGDPKQWPGDSALRGLERAGPRGAQLAAQISGEVREMAARAADTGAEWRTLPMPWNNSGQIERVALILRREGDSDEDSDKKKSGKGKGTRFLINLDLSRLGEMQMDGMFHKAARTFDMMIRTKDPLPDHIRRDLAGLFANSNAAMGLAGGLSFQVVKKFPDPTASGPMADRGGVWA